MPKNKTPKQRRIEKTKERYEAFQTILNTMSSPDVIAWANENKGSILS